MLSTVSFVSNDYLEENLSPAPAGDSLAYLPDYVRALLDPDVFPNAPSRVELVQTHISYVFLTDDRAYKTKKPVDFGFIKQIDLETRHQFCLREVELNRRLAPNVYRAVVPIVMREHGVYAIGDSDSASDSEIVEWAVDMVRLPDDRTLAAMIDADLVPVNLVQLLVAEIIEFHDSATVVTNNPTFAGAAATREWWRREYSEASSFVGDTWPAADHLKLIAYISSILDSESVLFDQRLSRKCVVEGHGDLHAVHVYQIDGEIVIVDCIEFNEQFHFRYLDVGYEIGFLAMDLEARGRPDLSDEFVGRYVSSVGDETLSVLQPLHRAFRAFVRGKVESIGSKAEEVSAEQRSELAESARGYFSLASNIIERVSQPIVVILAGVSGSGKSTVGAALAARIGAAYVSSDVVRKQLIGLTPRMHVPADQISHVYGDEMSARTYEVMRQRTVEHLSLKRPVVLDATHSRRREREAALEVARLAKVPALIVELRVPEESARMRINHRETDSLTTSDATFAIYPEQVATFEKIDDSEGANLVLDASGKLNAVVDNIVSSLPQVR